MKRILFLLTFSLISLWASAQANLVLNRVVQDITQEPSMKHALFSVSVYNITKDSPVYYYNPQLSLAPASMCKIFTTGVAFDQLGSNFRFKTTLGYSGEVDRNGVLHGNLFIVGGGDPLLGSYRYKQTTPDSLMAAWLRAVKGYGIKSIDGRICVDASIFDNQPLHDSWQWGDVGNYYGVGANGLNFHENMYFAYFNSGKSQGYPAELVSTQPKNINLSNRNEVTTGAANSGDRVVVYGDPSSNVRYYRGTIPYGKRNFGIRCALPNPGITCAEQFAIYLRQNGVNVSSSVSEIFNRHENIQTVLDYYSNIYYVIAQYTNFTSNNMYAESIFKYLGYKRYGKGSYANGAKVLKDFFKSHNLENSGINIVDGSGLSRTDKVTTDFTCRFLAEMSRLNVYTDYYNSLAKVGETGTVKNLVPGLPAKVDMRVKSGSMDGVLSYAGYVTTASGDVLCFSIISNNHDCSNATLRSMIEKLLLKIGTI